jgi:hypothetical protein
VSRFSQPEGSSQTSETGAHNGYIACMFGAVRCAHGAKFSILDFELSMAHPHPLSPGARVAFKIENSKLKICQKITFLM